MENKNPVLYIWILDCNDNKPAEDFCKDHWIKSRGQGQDGSKCSFYIQEETKTKQNKTKHANIQAGTISK